MRWHFNPYKEDAEKRGLERAKEVQSLHDRVKNWALDPGLVRKRALARTTAPSAKARAKVTLAPVSFVKRGDQSG